MFYLSLALNTLCSFRDETNFFGGGCTMQHMQHTNWEVIILLATWIQGRWVLRVTF